jgi:hypothetical protein
MSSILPTKISITPDLIKVGYTLNGKPQLASDDIKDHALEKAMNNLVPRLMSIKELPDEAAEGYRCNALSISNSPTEEGDNLSAVISVTKKTTTGKADNMSTPSCLFEKSRSKSKATVLPQDAAYQVASRNA